MPDTMKIIRTFWQALKLLGLILLIALIIAAIYFQAPWKITALLIIILLSNILLPKGKKRWFWAAAGVVVIALIVWVFLPDDNAGWKPYTFDKELAAIEAKRAIPDSENAAIIYNLLLSDANNVSEPNLPSMSKTLSEPWLSEDYPEVAKWIKNKEGTIAILLQAAQKEKCRFPLNVDFKNYGKSLHRLSAPRHWVYLLIRSANNDLAENQTDAALGKYFCVLKIAKHLYQQSSMTDSLVAMAMEALSARQLNKFIITNNPTDEQLQQIEEHFADINHDWNSEWPIILDGEKLLCKNMLGELIYEVNPKGKVRLSRDPTAAIRAQQPKADIPSMPFLIKKLTKAHTILTWFFMPLTPQEASKIIDANYEKYYEMAKPDFDWTKVPNKPAFHLKLNFNYLVTLMAKMTEEVYYSAHDIYLRNKASQRGNRLIIGLRRYKNKMGQWPKTLDEIIDFVPAEAFVDPLNGCEFVYKLTEENFTLYSKGKNGIDEGGKYQNDGSMDSKGHWIPKSKEDDVLIWPSKSSNCN